jgi:hypothetical protein
MPCEIADKAIIWHTGMGGVYAYRNSKMVQ